VRAKARRTMICENFFAHCDLSNGADACWPFLRSKNALGYGRVWVNGKCEEAHRFAFTLSKGEIPIGMCVLHSCDFPSCCNPAHLRIGTARANAADREERQRGRQPAGEANAQSVLTAKDVIFIRRCRDIYNSEQMAKMLGVQRSNICKVLSGDAWKHVIDLGTAAVARETRRHAAA